MHILMLVELLPVSVVLRGRKPCRRCIQAAHAVFERLPLGRHRDRFGAITERVGIPCLQLVQGLDKILNSAHLGVSTQHCIRSSFMQIYKNFNFY